MRQVKILRVNQLDHFIFLHIDLVASFLAINIVVEHGTGNKRFVLSGVYLFVFEGESFQNIKMRNILGGHRIVVPRHCQSVCRTGKLVGGSLDVSDHKLVTIQGHNDLRRMQAADLFNRLRHGPPLIVKGSILLEDSERQSFLQQGMEDFRSPVTAQVFNHKNMIENSGVIADKNFNNVRFVANNTYTSTFHGNLIPFCRRIAC